MRSAFRLPAVLGQSAVIVTTGSFALVLAVFKPLSTPGVGSVGRGIGVAAAVLLPVGAAGWWSFRKLRAHYERREALAVAISFAVFSPLSLVVAIPLAAIPGGYAGYLGSPFGLIGAFLSIVLMLWLATFLPSVFILWLLRRLRRAE